jgi:hypothetical protein
MLLFLNQMIKVRGKALRVCDGGLGDWISIDCG